MLCYRCGSHNSDASEVCGNCGQKLDPRQVSSTFTRRRIGQSAIEGAPYRAGDVIADRYRVKDIQGAGPHGFVFRAVDIAVQADVALKVISPKLVGSGQERDAVAQVLQVARKLAHPNLVRVLEHGVDVGGVYFVTQFVDGLSLRRILDGRRAKKQAFGLGEVEPLIQQIAAGLEAAHKLGVHGDLKPDNVLVQPDVLRVTDFGLGVALPRTAFVQAQRQHGLEGYLAPEVVLGRPLDPRSDTYALGVLFGELLCGQLPAKTLPPLSELRPDLPGAIEGVYRKALSDDPGLRYQTPAELVLDLSNLVQRAGARPQAQASVAAMASAAIRAADRSPSSIFDEPPPVPDEHLPGAPPRHRPPPVAAPREPQVDTTRPFDESMLPPDLPLRPTDETQPLDSALVAQAIAAKVAASKAAASVASPPNLRAPEPASPTKKAPHTESGEFTQPVDSSAFLPLLRGSGAASGADHSPTMSLPAFPAEFLPPQPLFRSTTPVSRLNAATVWLVLLTAVGLISGTIGGYILLKRLQRRPVSIEARGLAPAPRPSAAAQPDAGGAPVQGGGGTAVPGSAVAPAAASAPKAPCPREMLFVQAGRFQMGTKKGDPMMGFDERALEPVDVGAFCIDQFEYPNMARTAPKARVTWPEAKRFCSAVGKRLCTEAEWEKACKGPGNRRFPYGDAYDASACNTESAGGSDRELARSGGYDRCRSGYGVNDLSGNVAEWTSSSYGKAGKEKVQKGGAFDRPDYAARCSARRNGDPGSRAPGVGFRCCVDAR